MSYTRQPGTRNGVPGVWFVVQDTGGPGNYPVTRRYFVSDAEITRVDGRNVNRERPWESYHYEME